MTTLPTNSRSVRSRRSIVMIAIALTALLAVYFATQVLNGGYYRNISDANRATHPAAP